MATNVLVVGSGGREHTLAWKLAQSPSLGNLYCAPGNPGTAELANNIPATSVEEIARAIEARQIDLTVIGPEAPLADGLADELVARGHLVFGPRQSGARIESSKAWAKEIMHEMNIPTGQADVVSALPEALAVLERSRYPVVVKADGLAAGKGVLICASRPEAELALRQIMVGREFGTAGDTVLIEEFLSGTEVSLLAVTDGQTIVPLIPACDYKRAGDGDTGLNTGGMGAYTPPGQMTADLVDTAIHRILRPAIHGMRAQGIEYRGVLYAGLILTADGLKVLEFNCRFGDPEAQVVLPMLDSDLLELCLSTARGELAQLAPLEWRDGACVCVVLASGGYPGEYQTGYPISGLADLPEGAVAFHAGTSAVDGATVTAGGRVLAVSGLAGDIASARELAYAAAGAISFEGAFYRSDIALRELDSHEQATTG